LETRLSDRELWESYKNGDRAAFGLLFRTYYPLLFQFGFKYIQDRELLEDCIQDLFVELWQNKSSKSVQSIKAYLFKSVKYKIFRALRKAASGGAKLQEDMHFELSHDTILIEIEEKREQLSMLSKAMQQLTSRQKEIIYLQYYQRLSYEEVSEVMEISYQAARNLCYQAVKALKREMGGG
jgi:RNA polymerase sigma factor (sigma-70 family)